MDVLFDRVEDGTVVFEKATVCISTTTLQRARLTGRGRQGLQVQGGGLGVGHVYLGARGAKVGVWRAAKMSRGCSESVVSMVPRQYHRVGHRRREGGCRAIDDEIGGVRRWL